MCLGRESVRSEGDNEDLVSGMKMRTIAPRSELGESEFLKREREREGS